jgi:intracellular sulfur oxidation DsrE/DsrF family protein
MKPYNIYSTILASAFLIVTTSAFSLNALAVEASNASGQDVAASKASKVVIQVSDNDPKKWNLALNNAKNIQQDLGKNNVDVEIVAYGPGLPMLKLDSETGTRIADAIGAGVKVVACENTMRNTKLTNEDMLPNLSYVKSGVPYLMKKQAEGYSYIRP